MYKYIPMTDTIKVIDRDIIRQHLANIKPLLHLDPARKAEIIIRIKQLLKEKNATIIAHYYVDDALQSLADETDGFVGDSLEMAKFGSNSSANTLVVAGVKFMGETAKILNPEKTVIMPTLAATCSLDLSCPAEQFKAFCAEHPEHTSVVYANTSAEVKACADWVVTSSIALDVIEHLQSRGEKIIWAPDKHLGSYLQQETGADMLLWDGACIVHEEFRAKGVEELKQIHPAAAVLAHPESPTAVLEIADVVGSTSQLIKASGKMDNPTFIVATDKGIFHKMREAAPDKDFIPAPTAGNGATCRSCAHCPWMAMNSLENLAECLTAGNNQIKIPPETIVKAKSSIMKMMEFHSQEVAVVNY